MRKEALDWWNPANKGAVKDPRVMRFIRKIAKKIRLEKAILFGSRARGDWLVRSDYDFVLVSPDFEGRHFTERASDVLRKAYPGFAVDLLCYTPFEFREKKKEIGIVRNAVREGIELT